MKPITVGEADFSQIVGQGRLYVDKTQLIHQLVESGKFYFLSRPRRFGKSLLVSTMKYLFQGRQELFEGLWIFDNHDWTKKHPVLQLSFITVPYQKKGLEQALCDTLDNIARDNGLSLRETASSSKFAELIKTLSKSAPVAVLIDEYDKPIIDFIDDIPQANENREILRNFYGILKDSDLSPSLRMVFITGVSKFARVSIFPELNNLNDLTIQPNYSTLLGITQQELETDFSGHIDSLTEHEKVNRAEILEKIKFWYNGFSWDGKSFVYNPFSLLNLFSSNYFDNYWFNSGTPTFLVKALRNFQIAPEKFEEGLEVTTEFFQKFDIEKLDPYSLMLQTGYMTIQSVERFGDENIYKLGIPNEEVRRALLRNLLESYAEKGIGQMSDTVLKIQRALFEGKTAVFKELLQSVLADISFTMHPRDRRNKVKLADAWEGYFHSLTYLLLKLIGVNIQTEISKAKGRMDALIQTPKQAYVVEFKIGTAEEAMRQIKEQGYADAFRGGDRPIVLLGIGFEAKERNVKSWLVETVYSKRKN